MREYKLVEAALQAMGDDEDTVKVIMDGQTKSTEENMEHTNNGAALHSDKTVRFSTKRDTATIHMKGEKEKGSVSRSHKANP